MIAKDLSFFFLFFDRCQGSFFSFFSFVFFDTIQQIKFYSFGIFKILHHALLLFFYQKQTFLCHEISTYKKKGERERKRSFSHDITTKLQLKAENLFTIGPLGNHTIKSGYYKLNNQRGTNYLLFCSVVFLFLFLCIKLFLIGFLCIGFIPVSLFEG